MSMLDHALAVLTPEPETDLPHELWVWGETGCTVKRIDYAAWLGAGNKLTEYPLAAVLHRSTGEVMVYRGFTSKKRVYLAQTQHPRKRPHWQGRRCL